MSTSVIRVRTADRDRLAAFASGKPSLRIVDALTAVLDGWDGLDTDTRRRILSTTRDGRPRASRPHGRIAEPPTTGSSQDAA